MDPKFFATPADFRAWLSKQHASVDQLLVGFWKKDSGKPSVDWPQARDQALCFGWIDGVRKWPGRESYTIRFSPRRPGSVWSKVDLERYAALKAEGEMTAAGIAAFEAGRGAPQPLLLRGRDERTDGRGDRTVQGRREGVGRLGKAPAGLPQGGASLGYRRQEARDSRPPLGRPDRGQRARTQDRRRRYQSKRPASLAERRRLALHTTWPIPTTTRIAP